MKKLGGIAIGAAVAGNLTTEEWLLILGIIVTILNILIEYLKSRKVKENAQG